MDAAIPAVAAVVGEAAAAALRGNLQAQA